MNIEQYKSHIEELDSFIYLLSLRRIFEECYADLRSFRPNDHSEFWRINKYFLSYLNAVYTFREFLNHYEDQVFESVLDPAYNRYSFYRLTLELRNLSIHKSFLIKDYLSVDFAPCFRCQDLINAAEKTKTKQKPKPGLEFSMTEQLRLIEENYQFLIVQHKETNEKLLMVVPWLDYSRNDIQNVFDEAIDAVYYKKIERILRSLITLLHTDHTELPCDINKASILKNLRDIYYTALDLYTVDADYTVHVDMKILFKNECPSVLDKSAYM